MKSSLLVCLLLSTATYAFSAEATPCCIKCLKTMGIKEMATPAQTSFCLEDAPSSCPGTLCDIACCNTKYNKDSITNVEYHCALVPYACMHRACCSDSLAACDYAIFYCSKGDPKAFLQHTYDPELAKDCSLCCVIKACSKTADYICTGALSTLYCTTCLMPILFFEAKRACHPQQQTMTEPLTTGSEKST